MSTAVVPIAIYIAYIVWRIHVDRNVRRRQESMQRQIDEIQDVLKACPQHLNQ
jgi:hypothetical protein